MHYPELAAHLNQILQEIEFDEVKKVIEIGDINFERHYIPILRGMRDLSGDSDLYANRTKADYFAGEKDGKLVIDTGLQFNKLVKQHLLGDLSQRELVSDYQDFLSKNFFEGVPVALIPKEEGGALAIKINDEKEGLLSQLGDGLQSIIEITLPIFLQRGKNLLVFIEEPEHCLHPGFQRKLFNSLLKYTEFSNCQYFMTTHSNHFLDISQEYSDVSIYGLTKKLPEGHSREKIPTFSIQKFELGDELLLDALGANKSSVFLTNCSIWVEGITDRLYLRKYLELYTNYLKQANKYLTDYQEDLHYSFVEYSGSNITHWFDLDNSGANINIGRLCGTAFLLVDKDNQDKRKERFEKLKTILREDRLFILPCREIENLLKSDILRGVVAHYENKLVEEIPNMPEGDYKEVYLGKYIESKLSSGEHAKYADESGTIYRKQDFCKQALDKIKTWEDLSSSAKKLTEAIYKFIGDCNR
jgi:predicted ATP-dependent endonuclease of OLD family